MRLARQHDNVWLELSSQGVTQVHELLNTVGMYKLLFGTDWPFYPQAVTLAKVLIVAEQQPAARDTILSANAVHVLARGNNLPVVS